MNRKSSLGDSQNQLKIADLETIVLFQREKIGRLKTELDIERHKLRTQQRVFRDWVPESVLRAQR